MTIHIPQRLDGESFEAYRARRAESAAWTPIAFAYPPGQQKEPRRNLRRALKREKGNRQWRRMVLKAYKLKAARLAPR